MIPIDWKNRFSKDCIDFVEKRLPKEDYDIGIVYNVYPVRVNRAVPDEVIVFIAKKLAKALIKTKQDHFKFYKYLWNKKYFQGKLLCCTMFSVFLKSDPDFFFLIEKDFVQTAKDDDLTLLINKGLSSLFKLDIAKTIKIVNTLIKIDNKIIDSKLKSLLVKTIKGDEASVDFIIDKTMWQWEALSKNGVGFFSKLLREIFKLFPSKYNQLFVRLSATMQPSVIEILCLSIDKNITISKEIKEQISQWTNSGNNRIKKSALSTMKKITRKRKSATKKQKSTN